MCILLQSLNNFFLIHVQLKAVLYKIFYLDVTQDKGA